MADNCCLCFPQAYQNTNSCTPSGPCKDGCLYFPNLLVSGDDSVGPCNETALISFENLTIDERVCDNEPLQYTLYSNTDNVENITIDSTGITLTSVQTEALANPVAEVQFIVSCKTVSLLVSATVVFKNRCLGVICTQGQVCDKCTGDCVEAPVDISVEAGTAPTLDIKVT